MKIKSANVLPKTMPGTVHAQYVKCGKSNCKCADGELHGAYYYHFIRVGGRLKKRYLKADEVRQVQKACLLRQQQERKRHTINADNWRHLRELRSELREILGVFAD